MYTNGEGDGLIGFLNRLLLQPLLANKFTSYSILYGESFVCSMECSQTARLQTPITRNSEGTYAYIASALHNIDLGETLDLGLAMTIKNASGE